MELCECFCFSLTVKEEWIEHLEYIYISVCSFLHDDELIKMLMSFRGTLTFVSNQIWIQQQRQNIIPNVR